MTRSKHSIIRTWLLAALNTCKLRINKASLRPRFIVICQNPSNRPAACLSKLPSRSHRSSVTASIHVQQLCSFTNNLSFPSLIITLCRSGTSSFKCWNLRQASRACWASVESHPKAFMMLLIDLSANSFSTYCPVIDRMAEVGQQYTHCLWYWSCLWHGLYEHYESAACCVRMDNCWEALTSTALKDSIESQMPCVQHDLFLPQNVECNNALTG